MLRLLVILIASFVLPSAVFAEDPAPPSMKWPITIVVAASAADILSTDWPMTPKLYEINPLLPNHRGMNAAVQAATTAVVVYALHRYGPKHPKWAKVIAIGLGTLGTIDTIHNRRFDHQHPSP